MKNKIFLLFPFLIIISVIAGLLLITPKPGLIKESAGNDNSSEYNNKISVINSDATPEFTASPSPTPEPKENIIENEKLIFSFMGDILLDSHVNSLIEQFGPRYILSDVKQVLTSSDVAMANFESPMSENGTRENDKQFAFRANPQNVNVLTEGGINVVALANNHILDFGTEALLDTFKFLKASNIRYAGAGENAETAYAPVYIDKNGVRTAFLSSSHVIPFLTWHPGDKKPGVSATYDPARVLSEIAKAKKNADIIVIYLHWGEEMKQMPENYQKSLARMYIDNGADIVIGSHPHVLQGLEFYKGKVIAYSLGNFIFTNQKMDTMILNVEIKDKKISKVQVVPSRIENFRPVLINDPAESKLYYSKLNDISFGVEIDSGGIVSQKSN